MAKTKKPTKKLKLNPANFERNLTIVLLVIFLVSTGLLLKRNMASNEVKVELGEGTQQTQAPQE